MEMIDLILALVAGVGLAAATGFRVFVPLLVMSMAARAGALPLAGNMQWIATDAAMVALVAATALEIAGYYVPWVDNLLDTIATPAAAVAGTLAAAAVFGGFDPMLQWVIGIVAGGGTATVVQLATVATRATSTATTGGLGNSAVSTAEAGLSTVASVVSVLVVVLPLVGLALLVLLGWGVVRFVRRRRGGGGRHLPGGAVGA